MAPVIPDRFRDEIRSHLILNYVGLSGYPLILGVFGRPGDGKSFQLRHVLHEFGVKPYSVSAADLESDRAGNPAKLVRSTYLAAGEAMTNGGPAALVIDDFDTTVGEWSQNTGTVNHQQILAQLMHLADQPTYIEGTGTVRRVPMIITGNDFSKLYDPLKRPGRMAGFLWEARVDELHDIVGGIMAEWPESVRDALVTAHSDAPVSFFAQVRTYVIKSSANALIRRFGSDLGVIAADPGRYRTYIEASHDPGNGDLEGILRVARQLAAGSRAVDAEHMKAYRPRMHEASAS